MPSPSPFPAERICVACQDAVDENNCPDDWEHQKDFINTEVMADCTFALIDACQNGGGSLALCRTGNPIVADLGWKEPEDFAINKLLRWVPRSAPPSSHTLSAPPSYTIFAKSARPHAWPF